MQNITGSAVTRSVSSVLLGVNVLCLFLWTAFLSRRGQVAAARLGLPARAEDEARLLARLDALNETLLRACRR